MSIIYEINPPKIPKDSNPSDADIEDLLSKLKERVSSISKFCDGIHVTDSVLGTSRVSAIKTGKILKNNHPNLKITISARVRDKDLQELEKLIGESIANSLDGVLILKGDPSIENPTDSGLIPSKVVKHFTESQFADKTDFFLSLPSNPNFEKIQKKIDARPSGFMTQVIHSEEQVKRICEKLKPQGFKIIPCILLPSDKNMNSAQFLNLDWSGYKNDVKQFIKNIHNIAGDVLITSPSDFVFAKETLQNI